MEYHEGSQLRHAGSLTSMVAHRYGEKTAVVSQSGEHSYAELEARANKVANVLVENGVGAGDRVGLYLPNVFQFPESFFGAIKAGAIPVALNLRMDPDSLTYILADADVDHLVSSPLLVGGLETERATVTDPAELAEAAGVGTHYVGGMSGDGLVNYSHAVADASDAFDVVERDFGDVAIQTYTSGTTGKPKGVLLTHENVLKTLESLSKSPAGAVDPDDTVLFVLPMFHIPTMFAVFGTHLYRGATVVLQALPDPQAMLRAVGEHEVTNLPAVPALHTMMWREYREDPDAYDLSSLEVLGAGAAPLPEDTQRSLIDAWGASFTEVWGMTETTSVATVRPATHWKPAGCIGKPVPNVDVQLVDPETREPVVTADVIDPLSGPVDETLDFEDTESVTGEIAIRGEQVFERYYDLPEVNDEAFGDREARRASSKSSEERSDSRDKGWFYTGDIARVDADGDLWLVDRADDMIITGGENVYPTEVEDALYDHPDVAEAAVVAAPHEVKGEAPVAFVVLEDGAEAPEDDFRRWTLDRVPTYAHPRRVFFVDELPRSATRKVQRFELEADAEARLEGPLESSDRL
jgi:long-chain acyl-CoA synthetase